MRIEIVEEKGGYALPALKAAGIGGTVLEKPFVLLSGPNGAGKSALLGAIRSSIGIDGQRHGEPIPTRGRGGGWTEDLPATLDVEALGYAGQSTFLFDSRAVSTIPFKSAFDHDMLFHASMLAGGAGRVSHGEFVRRVWKEAVGWACSSVHPHEKNAASKTAPRRSRESGGGLSRHKRRPLEREVASSPPPYVPPAHPERWLLLDEPENAIDVEQLIIGMCALLSVAEVGRLRVVCSSHSLAFANGLADHPSVQVVDFCRGQDHTWLDRQRNALAIVEDVEKIGVVGRGWLDRSR